MLLGFNCVAPNLGKTLQVDHMLLAANIPVHFVLSFQFPFAVASDDVGHILPQFIET